MKLHLEIGFFRFNADPHRFTHPRGLENPAPVFAAFDTHPLGIVPEFQAHLKGGIDLVFLQKSQSLLDLLPQGIGFGFLDGKLQLFQLRPFLESKQARGSSYLNNMDKALQGRLDRQVKMQEIP